MLGRIVVELGGGRRSAEDPIDSAVGLADVRGLGEQVDADRPLAVVHARSRADAETAARALRAAVTVGDAVSAKTEAAVLQRIGPP
jgi:thymidine phosphorylase